MTENEVLEMLLDIKEIQIDRFDVQGQSLHIRHYQKLKGMI